jgi:putative sterol carrier protein
MIYGRADKEIIAGLERHGVDTVLEQIFIGTRDPCVPERAAGQAAVIQYDIEAPGGTRTWQVKVVDGRCDVTRAASVPAGVTIAMALPDFVRLLSGQAGGATVFMSGKLTMAGNFALAQLVQAWLDQGA